MRRVHTFELEDQAWFPSWLRSSLTRLIAAFCRGIGVPDALAPLVRRALQDQGLTTIVDLGSGAGGILPDVLDRVREAPGFEDTTLRLTDAFPDPEARAFFADVDGIDYDAEPLDATDLTDAPTGLKTMVNAFHHLRPDDARRMLERAEAARQPLLIYELSDAVPFVPWLVFLPLGLAVVFVMALIFTPFVRPLTLRQLVLTYVIPVIPACYAWDGQASAPRIYGLSDLDELLEGLGGEGYTWEKGPATTPSGSKRGIYLLGLPTGG